MRLWHKSNFFPSSTLSYVLWNIYFTIFGYYRHKTSSFVHASVCAYINTHLASYSNSDKNIIYKESKSNPYIYIYVSPRTQTIKTKHQSIDRWTWKRRNRTWWWLWYNSYMQSCFWSLKRSSMVEWTLSSSFSIVKRLLPSSWLLSLSSSNGTPYMYISQY